MTRLQRCIVRSTPAHCLSRLIDIRHQTWKVEIGYQRWACRRSTMEMTAALPRYRDAIRSAKSKYRYQRDGGFLRDVQLIIDLIGAAWSARPRFSIQLWFLQVSRHLWVSTGTLSKSSKTVLKAPIRTESSKVVLFGKAWNIIHI